MPGQVHDLCTAALPFPVYLGHSVWPLPLATQQAAALGLCACCFLYWGAAWTRGLHAVLPTSLKFLFKCHLPREAVGDCAM